MKKTNSSSPSLAMGVLISLSVCHCCNDTLQAVVNSLYPMIKNDLALSFVQIGLITLVYLMSASVLQPLFGLYLDSKPNPWFITIAAGFTFGGMAVLAFAQTLWLVVGAVILIGTGSSIVHPEASRLTSLASGGRKGLAQSIFQVGGNLGSSLGPLFAALVIAPYGREYTLAASIFSAVGIVASVFVARWYKRLLSNSVEMTKEGTVKKKLVQKGDKDWI